MTTENLDQLDDRSKVWIYQADRELTDVEVSIIRPFVLQFIENWVSHNRALKAYGDVFHNRFVVLMVDETQAPASGCSIDKSLHFIKFLGNKLGVDFFDRMNFAYYENESVRTVKMHNLSAAIENSSIKEDTLMFDNLVKSKKEFVKSWLKPLKESWHFQFV